MDSNRQEFSGWTRTVLGTIIVPFTEKVFGDHNYEVLTSSRNGIQRQSEHFAGKQRHDTDGYNIIPRGYCTYRNRSDDGLFTFNMNNIVDEGIVSKFYPVFTFQNANSTFMMEYLNGSPRVRAKLSVLAVGTSQVVLSFETLKETSFYLPTFEEQNRIAALLSTLNKRIEKQRLLIEHLKKYKRGVVDSIFKRRISLNDYSWNEITIADLFEPISDKNHPNDTVLTIVQGQGTIPRDSIERRITYDKASVKTYKRANIGDFILHLRSFEGGLEKANSQGIVSPAYTILRPKIPMATGFYYAYFRSYWFINNKLRNSVEGIRDGKSINMNTFWQIKVPNPPYEEQLQLAQFFEKLDSRIDEEERLLEHSQAIRTALYKNLFI